MYYRRWIGKSNNEEPFDIEFWCPETPEENKKFNKAIESLKGEKI